MSRIYALRDRLIEYYLKPFVADSDNQVKASLSDTINGERNHAIQQAPHHFELWKLGEINEETGKVTAAAEFLCDCSSLVREGVRQEPVSGVRPLQQAPYGSSRPIGRVASDTRPNGLHTPETPHAAAGEARQADTGAGSSPDYTKS